MVRSGEQFPPHASGDRPHDQQKRYRQAEHCIESHPQVRSMATSQPGQNRTPM